MNKITTMKIAEIGDLKLLAWKIGVVYFQIYLDKPNIDFYGPLSTCLEYEQIVEVPTDPSQWNSLALQLGYKGVAPVFGAISGGWVRGLTDEPNEAEETVREARRQVVMPSQRPARPRSPDDEIELHGL